MDMINVLSHGIGEQKMLSKEECEQVLMNICSSNSKIEDRKVFKDLINEHFELVEEHEKYKKALDNAIKQCCINVSGSDACNSLDELYKAFESKVWKEVCNNVSRY